MERKSIATVASTLEEVQQRFEAWRGSGRKGRRIPEELWNLAAELAREMGVNPVVRALHLDYGRLKRRVVVKGTSAVKSTPTATGPAFVEFAMDGVSRRSECVVEFEGRRGKVSIRLAEQDPVDIVALAEAFFRGVS